MSIRPDDVKEVMHDEIPMEFLSVEIYRNKELQSRFRRWMKENGIYYYARPREEFFPSDARELAAESGCRRVLMEDMS